MRTKWNGILTDLFHPSYFAVTKEFDEPLGKFVNEAIMYLGQGTIVNCFVVLFGSLPNSNELGLFYRWYGTSKEFPRQTLTAFSGAVPYHIGGEQHAINIEHAFGLRHPVYARWNTTLAACFLYDELQKLGVSVDTVDAPQPNVIAEISKLKRNQSASDYWIVDKPQETFPSYHKDAFSAKTKFSLFCPFEIDEKLAGVVVFDASKSCSLGKHDKWFHTIAKSLRLILKTAYKAYYSQLDPPPSELLTLEEASGWDAPSWVFGPQFLLALKTFATSNDSFKSRRYGILYLDLNGVKHLNDNSSHAFGNEAIRAFGHWIAAGFKKTSEDRELIPPDLCWWVVRWGGDEFIAVVCLPDEEDFGKFMELLFSAIRKQILRGRPKFSKVITKRWKDYSRNSSSIEVRTATGGAKQIRDLVNKLSAAAGCMGTTFGERNSFERSLYRAEVIMYRIKDEMKDQSSQSDLTLHYSIEDNFTAVSMHANP